MGRGTRNRLDNLMPSHCRWLVRLGRVADDGVIRMGPEWCAEDGDHGGPVWELSTSFKQTS